MMQQLLCGSSYLEEFLFGGANDVSTFIHHPSGSNATSFIDVPSVVLQNALSSMRHPNISDRTNPNLQSFMKILEKPDDGVFKKQIVPKKRVKSVPTPKFYQGVLPSGRRSSFTGAVRAPWSRSVTEKDLIKPYESDPVLDDLAIKNSHPPITTQTDEAKIGALGTPSEVDASNYSTEEESRESGNADDIDDIGEGTSKKRKLQMREKMLLRSVDGLNATIGAVRRSLPNRMNMRLPNIPNVPAQFTGKRLVFSRPKTPLLFPNVGVSGNEKKNGFKQSMKDQKQIDNPNEMMNLMHWHQDVTHDACDPLITWKVRKAILGLKWHLLSMRDPTSPGSLWKGSNNTADPNPLSWELISKKNRNSNYHVLSKWDIFGTENQNVENFDYKDSTTPSLIKTGNKISKSGIVKNSLNGNQPGRYYSDKFVKQLDDMEQRVMSWNYTYDPSPVKKNGILPSLPVPKCARNGYWNNLEAEIKELEANLIEQFSYALGTKLIESKKDELKSYQAFVYDNFTKQMNGSKFAIMNKGGSNKIMSGNLGPQAKTQANTFSATNSGTTRKGAVGGGNTGMHVKGAVDLAKNTVDGALMVPEMMYKSGNSEADNRESEMIFLPGPRARPKPNKFKANTHALVTLDDINMIRRYCRELYDIVHAVPRHADWSLKIDRPSTVSQYALQALEGTKRNFGIPPIPIGMQKVITDNHGTTIKKLGAAGSARALFNYYRAEAR